MLGQMGMPDVSSDQIQFLLRLGTEPDLLARLAAGMQAPWRASPMSLLASWQAASSTCNRS